MSEPVSHQKIHRLRRFLRQRRAFYILLQRTLSRIKSFDQTFVIFIALCIGLMSGVLAAGFRALIAGFTSLLWNNGQLLEGILNAPLWLKLTVPVAGAVVVATMVQRFAPEAKGHGVPEVMDAIVRHNGFIRIRVVLIKALASAISIASGASVGREGPIVQMGSAFGSAVGQFFQVSSRRMRTFVGCGAAAGIAATFNAPIAGAIFASEVILGDFSVTAIGPIIVSSVFGTVVSRSIEGNYPSFVPPVYQLQSPVELIFYIILGVLAGLAGWLFVKTLYGTEDLFDGLKLPIWVKAAVGGLVIGLVAVFRPEILGVGYPTIDKVLAGGLPLLITALLIFGKIGTTSWSLGYGASGGVFAPSLFIGSMLGGTFGQLVHTAFPGIAASSGAYALVGMAAMVAAATHAPITSVLIIFEMTTEYSVILPLMVASIISTAITNHLIDGNIYTIKLKRRGIEIHGGTDINLLDQLSVAKLKEVLVEKVPESMSLTELLEMKSKSKDVISYALDEEGRLCGVITQSSLRRYLNHMEEIPADTCVRDFMNLQFDTIRDDTPIHETLRTMMQFDLEALPVVDDAGLITGQLTRSAILEKYQETLLHNQSAQSMASSMKFIHRAEHERTEVVAGFLLSRISVPSSFVGQSITNLNVRNRFGVDVLLVRRLEGTQTTPLMPANAGPLRPADELMIFGRSAQVDALSQQV